MVEWLTPEEKLAKVSKFFDTVSNPNSPRPVTAEELPIDEIIDLLRSSGIDFEVAAKEEVASLRQFQFRGFDQGKGPAVVAIIGKERTVAYFNWALEVSRRMKMPKLNRDKTPDQVSRVRGLMQFLGLTVGVATGAITIDEYVAEVNQRAYNGHVVKKANPEVLARNFPGFERHRNMASFPPGELPEAFAKIIDSEERLDSKG